MHEEPEQLPGILNNQVSVKNIVTRAAQGFSLTEKRIVFAAISKIDSRKPIKYYNAPDRRTVRVTADEYKEIAASPDAKTAYRDLMKAGNKLFDRYLRYKIITPRGERELRFRWVEGTEYHHGEGWIEITLSTKILPYLTELTQRFTKYKLEQTAGLRSVYSWRLLEYLTSWKEKGSDEGARTVNLDKFREVMEIPASYKWFDIRRKVIEPAVGELAAKDGWDIKWQGLKKGRSFNAITFVWQRSAQQDLFKQ